MKAVRDQDILDKVQKIYKFIDGIDIYIEWGWKVQIEVLPKLEEVMSDIRANIRAESSPGVSTP